MKRNRLKKGLSALLLLALLLSLCGCASSADPVERAAEKTAAYVLKTVEPVPGSEWAAVCLAAGGYPKSAAWLSSYLSNMEKYVAENQGLPGNTKTADYARTVLAVTAAGGDAASLGGVDLTAPLRDEELVSFQGIAALSFALLALDGGNYPADGKENYVNFILSAQLPDGGFAISGDRADPDTTAMALQALAPYRGEGAVDRVIGEALDRLSAMQGEDGHWKSWGVTNCESCAQVLLTLCTLGIPAESDSFRKNGVGLLDDLMSCAQKDGSFAHTPGGASDLMATLQALEALTALRKGNILQFGADTCTLEVRCDALLPRMDDLRKEKRELIPADGILLAETRLPFEEGESVMDVTLRALSERGIHYEFSQTPGTGSGYMEGIGNLYEFDAGAQSGWEYTVNGGFCAVSASQKSVSPGDAVCWVFTCDLGSDVGNGYGE